MSLINYIVNEIQTDEDDESDALETYYLSLGKPFQEVIDHTFIRLCGWSLKTLIKNSKKDYISYTGDE